MKFIVISTSETDVSDLLGAEAERAGQLLESGVFLDLWPKTDMSGAVVLAEATDEVEVRRAVETMPTVVAHASTYQVIALLDTGAAFNEPRRVKDSPS